MKRAQRGRVSLGRAERIGTLQAGKQADVVVVEGDPPVHISDVEKVTWVFKQGVAYDSAKLIESVRGLAGIE